MRKQKYPFEVAMVLSSNGLIMLRPTEIEEGLTSPVAPDFIRDCHIYMITKRCRVSLNPDFIYHDDEYICGELLFHKIQEKIKKVFRISKRNFSADSHSFHVSEYPHANLVIRDRTGVIRYNIPASTFIRIFEGDFDNLLDVEVLYIGQGYGKKGARSALERLKNHSTLQKIQADVISHDPDSEILLILIQYDEPSLFMITSGKDEPTISGDQGYINLIRAINEKIDDGDMITIAEAGLIRYFQPKYNQVYKDSFPSTNNKSLQKCQDLDFIALFVELKTSILGVKVYAQNINPSFYHMAYYDLHNEQSRKSFFDLLQ
ncbi:MAG TPA: hypothetical protein VFS21_03390 [Roseiflexaceae bacterium]|nr:hypothetical protein [Roseiflexaceae bacterium]